MRKKYFYIILFYFFVSPFIINAQGGPPAPKQQRGTSKPPGLPTPIDDWIPGLLVGATLTGSYYFFRKRKKLS